MALLYDKRAWAPTIVFVASVFVLLAYPGFARGAGWHLSLQAEPHGPSRFLVVDKEKQTFYMFEQKSPLKELVQFSCATGQVTGDKFREGDLKTPEGVYFVKSRLDAGLNYDLYGDLAFPLNFPNPVDIIKGKTGHGIWIHGRGHAVTPRETQGCVALNTPDIHNIDESVSFHMPIFIGEKVTWSNGPAKVNPDAKIVVEKTKQWAAAWQNESDDFFALHDKTKFAIAQGESFSSFEEHKRRLFGRLAWIKVHIDQLVALPGPDYWVTAFRQIYRSPTFTSAGIKRLYWQKDESGEYKIVGMEFEQIPVDRVLFASLEENMTSDAGSKSSASTSSVPEQTKTLVVAENTTPPAPQAAIESEKSIQNTPEETPRVLAQNTVAPQAPSRAEEPPKPKATPVVVAENTIKPTSAVQKNKTAPIVPKAEPSVQNDKKTTQLASNDRPAKGTHVPKESPSSAAKPSTSSQSNSLDVVAVVDIVNAWSKAWQSANLKKYLSFYSDDARQGSRHGKRAIRNQKSSLWETKSPQLVNVTQLRVTKTKTGCIASFVQEYAGEHVSARKGRKQLFFEQIDGTWRIVRETFERM